MAGNQNLVAKIIINAQDNASSVFETLKNNLGKLATLSIFKSALDEAAGFEAQLDKVAAKGGYTSEEMKKLSDFAKQVGVEYGKSGTEAAQGLEILAAAGLSASDTMKALPSVLALSTAEATDMETAASAVTASLSIMGLGFDQSARMADVLTKAANLSDASAMGLAESLKTTGGTATGMGYSLEQTVAMLDVFAKNGVKGEAAGTQLNAVLVALQNPASAARQELSKLGINTKDVGTAMDGLKKAGKSGEAAILAFGEVGGKGVRNLLKEGSAGIKAYETDLLNAGGSAKLTAQQIGDNFEGSQKRLSATLKNLQAEFAAPILQPLSNAFDDFTSLVSTNTTQIVTALTSLSELYGIKLVKDAATFAQGMFAANAAKSAAATATQTVVAAEQELIAAMAAGGTQTTRYQNAQAQLTAAMNEGGAATTSLAAKQSQLLTAQNAAQVATTRVATAQTELNAALLAGGAETQRYAQAQLAETAAKANSQLATQRVTTAQADLNAEIVASGATSVRAIALQQELNIAKLAAQTAAQRLTAAQTELNTAMTAGGANTERYAVALTELNASQSRASAASATLETRTAAVTASMATAEVATVGFIAQLRTLQGAFNGVMSAFAGWSIGTMVGEWSLQFEFMRTSGAYLAEGFVKLSESARYFFSGEFLKADSGTFSEKMAEIGTSFDEIRAKSTDVAKAANDATEAQKKAIVEQAKAVEEFSKLTLDKLKETTTAIDVRYKSENDLIKQNLAIQTEAIHSTKADALKKESEITAATIAASKEQLTNLEEAATQKRFLVNQVFQEAIDKAGEDNAKKKEYEKDYLESSKQIYNELLNSYSQTVSQMISAAQAHRDKAIGYAQEILNAEIRHHDGLLELERIGMNDAQLKASKKKEIAKELGDYKKAMADGDYKKAQEISEKTEKLVLDLAKTEKTQSSEVSSAKSEYNKVIKNTEEATKQLQLREESQASQLEQNANNQIGKMNDLRSRIAEIDTALAQGHQLVITVDNSAPESAISYNQQPTSSTHTIYVTTIQQNQNGGEIQYFADGGMPNFQRRKGKLDGYGGGDTVPAMLEPGEWIIKKEAVNKYGNDFMAQLNSMQIQDVPHFATGGTVLERNMQTGGWDYDYQKWLMRAPRDELFTYPMPTWDPPTENLLAEHNRQAQIAIALKTKQAEKEKVDVAKKEADTKTQSTPSQRPIADLIVSGSTNVPAPAPIPVITTIPVPTPEPIKIGTSSVAPIQAINPVASKPVTKVETTPVKQQVISNSAVPIYKSNNAAEKAAQDAKTEEESQKQKISQIRAKILDASGVEFETYNFEAIKQQQEEIRNLESEVNRLNPLILKGEDKKKNGGYDAERLIKIGDEAKAQLPDAIKAKQAAEQKLQAMIEQNQLVSKTESAAQKQAEAVVKQAQITKDAQQKLQEPDTSWHQFQEKPLPNYKVPPSGVPETNLKSEPTPVPTPVQKTQAQPPAHSNQIITIRFELPSGKTAQGSFTQNDSTNLINILKEAASRGLPANIG